MQDYFYQLLNYISTQVKNEEDYSAYFTGESSDFCRFNHSKVRQAGHVLQQHLRLNLNKGKRHAYYQIPLTGDMSADSAMLKDAISSLRQVIGDIAEDPYFVTADTKSDLTEKREGTLPQIKQFIPELCQTFKDVDAVGIFTSGHIYRGFGNSTGQRNWFSSTSFNLDWSVYHDADKAVKNNYAGCSWSDREFQNKVKSDLSRLDRLERYSERKISPGEYRVYLTPSALLEVFELLSWNAFGVKSQRTKSSALNRLVDGKQNLSPLVTFGEYLTSGTAPRFNEFGFIKPEAIPIVEKGRFCQPLVSPQSAAEYGIPSNGAASGEAPESLVIQGGNLKSEEVYSKIDKGLFISNLWYLNYSDLEAARMTGMTRFATFFVENGELKEPVNVMRFDESLYRMLGTNLVDLNSQSELLLSSSTYSQRSTDSFSLPGALIDDFKFTL